MLFFEGCAINKNASVCCKRVDSNSKQCVELSNNSFNILNGGMCNSSERFCYNVTINDDGKNTTVNLPYCADAQYHVCGEGCTVMEFSKDKNIDADTAQYLFLTNKSIPLSAFHSGLFNTFPKFVTLSRDTYYDPQSQLGIFRFGLGRNFDEFEIARMIFPVNSVGSNGMGLVEKPFYYITNIVEPDGNKCELKDGNAPHYECNGRLYIDFGRCIHLCGSGFSSFDNPEDKLRSFNYTFFEFVPYYLSNLYLQGLTGDKEIRIHANISLSNVSRYKDDFAISPFNASLNYIYNNIEGLVTHYGYLRYPYYYPLRLIDDLLYLYYSNESEYNEDNVYGSQFLRNETLFNGIKFRGLPFECNELKQCKQGTCSYKDYEHFTCSAGDKDIDCGCEQGPMGVSCFLSNTFVINSSYRLIRTGENIDQWAWVTNKVPTIKQITKPARIAAFVSSERWGPYEKEHALSVLHPNETTSSSSLVTDIYFNDSINNNIVDNGDELVSNQYLAIKLSGNRIIEDIMNNPSFKGPKNDDDKKIGVWFSDPSTYYLDWPKDNLEKLSNNCGCFSGSSCFDQYRPSYEHLWDYCNITYLTNLGDDDKKGDKVLTYKYIYNKYLENGGLAEDLSKLPILKCIINGSAGNGITGSIKVYNYNPYPGSYQTGVRYVGNCEPVNSEDLYGHHFSSNKLFNNRKVLFSSAYLVTSNDNGGNNSGNGGWGNGGCHSEPVYTYFGEYNGFGWDGIVNKPALFYIKAIETIEDEGFICLNPIFRSYYTPPIELGELDHFPYNTSVVLIFGKKSRWKKIYLNAHLVCDRLMAPNELGLASSVTDGKNIINGEGNKNTVYSFYFGSRNTFSVETNDVTDNRHSDNKSYEIIKQDIPIKYIAPLYFCNKNVGDTCTYKGKGTMPLAVAVFTNSLDDGNLSKFGRCDVTSGMQLKLNRYGICEPSNPINLAVEKVDSLADIINKSILNYDINNVSYTESKVIRVEIDNSNYVCDSKTKTSLLDENNVLYGCENGLKIGNKKVPSYLPFYFPPKNYLKERIKFFLERNILPMLFVYDEKLYNSQFIDDIGRFLEYNYKRDSESKKYKFAGKTISNAPIIWVVGEYKGSYPCFPHIKEKYLGAKSVIFKGQMCDSKPKIMWKLGIINNKCPSCLSAVAFPVNININRGTYSWDGFNLIKLFVGLNNNEHCIRPHNPVFSSKVNSIYGETTPVYCNNDFDVAVAEVNLVLDNPPYDSSNAISQEEKDYYENILNAFEDIGKHSIYFVGKPVVLYIKVIRANGEFSWKKFMRYLALSTKSLVNSGVIALHIEDLFYYDSPYSKPVGLYGLNISYDNGYKVTGIYDEPFLVGINEYVSTYASVNSPIILKAPIRNATIREENLYNPYSVDSASCLYKDDLSNYDINIVCKFPDGGEKQYDTQGLINLLNEPEGFIKDIIAAINDEGPYKICFEGPSNNYTYIRRTILNDVSIPIAYNEALNDSCINRSLSFSTLAHYLGFASEDISCIVYEFNKK